MTLRLILTRHAKSGWDDPMLGDHDRPLNARGREAAPRIGRWLDRNGHRPDTALISTAVRAIETWDGIAGALTDAPAATLLDRLYLAAPPTMLDTLARVEGRCVIIVAHNPGIAAFAARLLAERPGHAGFGPYPTGATTVIEFDIDAWKDAAPQTGRLAGFVVPRELE
ncbi:phosphohistidine phosphatase, SixA [Oceaniovalibus guishaninsula JLT2003]|uniref:Phosphohistidine phosphatase, SixA n=1 Tax=Oceaniovalibus guishaninsula JLT2003 TaxID=1231392 RepID=K2H9X5_9RHOB|nr:histidine phosphatase family protein [Oceaniovalibus guishaninsula]EKE43432.1 phosphohistidine phosphatase, SixA [Oceaniovalibus guishaninsula JLT2003]